MRYWSSIEYILAGLAVSLVVLLGLAVRADMQEAEQWKIFAFEQNCRVIGQTKGRMATGVGPAVGGSGGVAVTSTYIPGQTGYACDDGMEYWR